MRWEYAFLSFEVNNNIFIIFSHFFFSLWMVLRIKLKPCIPRQFHLSLIHILSTWFLNFFSDVGSHWVVQGVYEFEMLASLLSAWDKCPEPPALSLNWWLVAFPKKSSLDKSIQPLLYGLIFCLVILIPFNFCV